MGIVGLLVTLGLTVAIDQGVKRLLRRTLGSRSLRLGPVATLRMVSSRVWLARTSAAPSLVRMWVVWTLAAGVLIAVAAALPSSGAIIQSFTGNGTLVGQFSSTAVSGIPGAPIPALWIAANGDTIDTTYVGSLKGHVDIAPCQVVDAQPEDSYAEVVQIHTITGCTDRFAGVQGSFTVTKYHDVVNRNGTNGTCGFYSGTITPPGAARRE